MKGERDSRDNNGALQSSGYAVIGHQPQQTTHPDDSKGRKQRRTTKYPSTNQRHTENLAAFKVKTDPELAINTDHLEETAAYATGPIFKEKLREDLLGQFVAYHNTDKLERQKPLYQVCRFFLLLLGRFHR